MRRALPGIFGGLLAVARPHLPSGRDGRRLLLLATLVPLVLSCGLQHEGLGRATPVSEVGDGGVRDGGPTITGVDGRPTAVDARMDGPGRDTYAPPQTDARDAGAPGPDTATPPDTRPPPDAPRPDAAPPDTSPPPPDAPPGGQVLLLIGNANISAGDESVRAHIAMLGFPVQVKQAGNAQQIAEARALAAVASLVVMSNSLPEGGGLAAELRELPVPILCSKVDLWDNLGIGQQQGTSTAGGEMDLQIRAADHPLAAGRRGEIRVTTQARPFGLGVPVPAAVRIATIVEETDEVLIFGLEKGAAASFGPSPARRVGWFAHETTYLSLNENGWALFDAAVRWLTGP